MDSPPPPLPAKTRRSGQHAPVIVSATRHQHQHQHQPHVVKIRVNPVEPVAVAAQSGANTVRISISGSNRGSSSTEYPAHDDMRGGSPYYFYTSGQSSPSDTLDSGTCSDLDGSTPPPLPKKGGVTVTVNRISHQRGGSLTSSGAEVESDDEISCDSLNSSELDKQEESVIEPVIQESNLPETVVQDIRDRSARGSLSPEHESNLLETVVRDVRGRSAGGSPSPEHDELHRVQERVSRVSLTRDEPEIIRDLDERALFPKSPESLGNSFHTNTLDDHKPLAKKVSSDSNSSRKSFVEERTYEERKKNNTTDVTEFNPDNFYKFHLNEKNCESDVSSSCVEDEDYFAGCKGYLECGDPAASTIRSSKGTIRGVKNRVRAGIATFLQMHDTKTWAEREAGTVVVYTTTMGIVRSTYQRCLKVRQILRTHLVKFDERDVFMSRETQAEIRDRMHSDEILVPQVFIEGQYIGDAEVIERLNESGELRRILKPYKSADACTTCQVCGGYRLLPCAVCNGSKKSVHRNHFTTELVALKCMNCDEVGLVKCYAC